MAPRRSAQPTEQGSDARPPPHTRTHASGVVRTVLIVAVALATALALVPPSDASAGDYETVRDRKGALEAELAETTEALDQLRARIAVTREEIEELQEQAAQIDAQVAGLHDALADRARSAFKHGGETIPFQSLFKADGPDEAVERAGLIAALSRRDVAALERASALRERQEQVRSLLTARSAELEAMENDLEVRGASLQDTFEEVSEEYTELRRVRDRQRQVSRGGQQGTYACIFDGPHHFRDTWGDPRSGGRRHRGTDVMAPYRAPVYAITHGVVSRMSRSSLGGIALYLRGDDGVQYYYAHLDGYASGVHVGQRVQAGEHIGYNGYTGNASPSAAHVHFEAHPGGGAAVNPYPWLRAAC